MAVAAIQPERIGAGDAGFTEEVGLSVHFAGRGVGCLVSPPHLSTDFAACQPINLLFFKPAKE